MGAGFYFIPGGGNNSLSHDVIQDINTVKTNTAKLSVASNSLLVVLKLAVGWMSGSVSIISEAAHSAVDLLAALIAFVAVRKSGKEPDAVHAYGHGKIENVSGMIEAALIVLVSIWIVWESVDKLRSPQPTELVGYGMAVMLFSAGVNWWVSSRLQTVADQTHSHALAADALHLKTDVWTSIGVFLGLVAMKLTGLTWIDPAIAIVVAAIIFKAGWNMTWNSLYELTDISLPHHERDLIHDILATHPEVVSHHRLRTRRSGSLRQIDVHVLLDPGLRLDRAHAICDQVEAELESQLGSCDVVIHPEPAGSHERERSKES
ncbi:cation transporter [Anaerosporomusa subterranea]|uniref:Cation transporter n=1 Tax=Anaerosporomusa subterranea TaxID=1794912 RepID=A0A154BP78_ANASB|nr:cation transporter [Anaerosporomusa subterranea]